MAEVKSCRCVEVAVHLARNLDEAVRLMGRAEVGRSLIHAHFVRDEAPKLESCLMVDLSEVKRSIDKMGEVADDPEEAKRWLDRAYTRFHRAVRKCGEK